MYPCHPGCPPWGTHWNSLKIFYSELKAVPSCIMTTGGYVCVFRTFFFYWYSWHCTKSQCPRACCQAEPLYLLLGKLIFEKKYRISNLVQWNIIYRSEIIPGFFLNKWICFPNICSKSPLRTWVFISSSCILAILPRDLCHLYLSSLISILSFIFLFLYINVMCVCVCVCVCVCERERERERRWRAWIYVCDLSRRCMAGANDQFLCFILGYFQKCGT